MKSAAFLVVLLLLGACVEKSPPGPVLLTVSPSRVSSTRATTLTLTGENFEPAIQADLDRPSLSMVDLALRVRLLGDEVVDLANPDRPSPTLATAVVPGGVTVGRYTVELSTSRGVTTLADALEVIACPECVDAGPPDGGTADGGDGGPGDAGGADGGDAGFDAGCFSWPDLDRDGFGREDAGSALCPGAGRVANGADCHDGDPASFPDAGEVCNGADDDCDGVIDDGVCPADAGWTLRTDTGGPSSDWKTVSAFGPRRAWLAGDTNRVLVTLDGGFVDVSAGCNGKWRASWADPSGAAWLGGGFGANGVLATHALGPGSCGAGQLTPSEVIGLQGFGSGDVFGVQRDGALIRWRADGGVTTSTPGLGPNVNVSDLAGASPASLFAVGSNLGARPKVWRLATDGGAFVDQQVDLLSVQNQNLSAVFAVDDSLVYAVGALGALMELSDGGWRLASTAPVGLTGVRAFARGRVLAATRDGRMLRFDGLDWVTLVTLDAGVNGINDLAATAEDDVWLVGSNGVVYHWPD